MSRIESYSPPKTESIAAGSTAKDDCGCANEVVRQQTEFRAQANTGSRYDASATGTASPQSIDFGTAGDIYGKLCSGVKSYQRDQQQRAWGSLIGTVQGVGDVAVSLSTLADFTAALILNDHDRASKMGADFGKALGQEIVGGVRFYNAADQYLFNIGYSGDYAKPCRDVVALGQKLNERWNSLSPREQEREKSEFITTLVANAIVTEAGIGAINKASTFTDMLDSAAGSLKDATVAGSQKAANIIGQAVDTLFQPVADTSTGFNMPIPKSPENVDSLIAKMAKPGGESPISSKVESTGRTPERADSPPAKTNDAQEIPEPYLTDAKLPPFDSHGNLPPGIHECSLREIEHRFATNPERRYIFSRLVEALDELKIAGCKKVYVNGSFTTSKVNPGDFDICFDSTGIDTSKLNPILENQKIFGEDIRMRYGGDIKMYNPGDWKNNWLNFFQRDGRAGGIKKGIVLLNLGATP